jgi:deoxycytidylate deaminase
MEARFQGNSLENLFELREKYCIIGLTGRTSSGVSAFADKLTGNFDSLNLTSISQFGFTHNNGRKYNICYNFLENHWKPFKVIRYKDVLTLLVLSQPFDDLIEFLSSWIFEYPDYNFINGKRIIRESFKSNSKELNEIKKLKFEFESLSRKLKIHWNDFENRESLVNIWLIFISEDFQRFSQLFNAALRIECLAKRIKILQTISNSYRRCGMPYCNSTSNDSENVFEIAAIINYLIKGSRWINPNSTTRIVIDSLRNPLEVMYFKERYSTFYMLSINTDETERNNNLGKKFNSNVCDLIKEIDKDEYENKRGEFYNQDVMNCIQKSDVHINSNNLSVTDFIVDQNNIFNPTNAQILKFISLIMHPGLITPSPQERCMQIAFTAKYNSGCLSRQVGAVVSDSSYSIKSMGWNNTAEYQVPCILRCADDLLAKKDLDAFSDYEKSDSFTIPLNWFQTRIDKANMKGHNCAFCFKDLQNYIEKEKNQVHTRSLHAEENAFLQIAKYGGGSIVNGILFTTASPCELCSKKAYQLGITAIYYIDPYPGIAEKQVLKGGTKNPTLILFVGAIGRAYHKLYEPIMAYKDEMLILSGLKIPNYKKDLEKENRKLKQDIKELRSQLAKSSTTNE